MRQTVYLILFQFVSIGFVQSSKLEKGWWNDYEGTIGKEKIRLSLFYDSNKSLKGSYCYLKYGKKIELSGFVRGDSLFLTELENSKVTGKFSGVFSSSDSGIATGIWTNRSKSKQFPFFLQMVAAIPGQAAKRYSLPFSDEQIEEFAAAIIKKVKAGDKKGIAAIVDYPVEVLIADKKVAIHNQDEFVNLYSKIFQNQLVEKIANCQPYYLFEKYETIMLANGEIWFCQPVGSKELKILAIN